MRKKIKEEKLKNNEDDSLWNAPLPIYEIDFRGPKFIRVNDAFCRYTGHTRKQLLKKNPLSFLDNDSKTEFKERIRKKLAGKKVNTIIRCKSKTKDGRRHFAELNIAFIYNQNKKIKSAIIIIHDITDYKRTEETINLQKEELQTIMDSVPASIFYKDKNNNFLQVNKSFAKSMGVSKQELEGKSLFDLYPKEQAKAFLEDDLEVIKTGKPKLGIIEQAEGKKGIVWFQTDKIPYRDEKGNIIGIIGFSVDITDRLKLEKQKDEFMSIASHELKTPLTTIKAYIQILEKRLEKDKANKYFLTQISDQTNKIITLISDLMDVGKINAGKLAISKKKFDIDYLVEKIVAEFQYITPTHTIIRKNESQKMIRGDEDRIAQVLINLLTNAIKYSPKADKIIVDTKVNKKNVVISVQDFGVGISKENLPHVFEKYFRGKEDKRGFGLGLYISSEIIKQHRGKIWVKSKVGKGSTFYFSLPINK